MSHKLPVNGFKWKTNSSKFDENFIKSYDEDSKKVYILKVDIDYPIDLQYFHSDLPFLPERKKIKKCNKLLRNLKDKKKHVVYVRALKQA